MAEDPETQTDDPALVEDFDVVVLGTGARMGVLLSAWAGVL
jgi:hypothetical protein